jgi:hypothetical protein
MGVLPELDEGRVGVKIAIGRESRVSSSRNSLRGRIQ